jgi:TolA-binding protein
MAFGRVFLILLLMSPAAVLAQKREIQELQRDMALMQDEVRSMNEKLTNLAVMIEQLVDKVNSTNTAVTVLESGLQDTLSKQQSQLTTPVASVGSKVDQMASEFRFVRESVTDLNSRFGKIETRIEDLQTSIQIMSAPPAPPSGGEVAAPSGGEVAPLSGGAVAGSAETLYDSARRDQSGGKLDLALLQYQDLLANHPNSNLAPAAQYSIGEIHFANANYEAAREAFDLVLEKYPANDRTPDAMYMKAKSLSAVGQTRSAAREYRALLKQYPNAEIAARAQEELTALGY